MKISNKMGFIMAALMRGLGFASYGSKKLKVTSSPNYRRGNSGVPAAQRKKALQRMRAGS